MRRAELLAPAGSAEALRAVIASGANAVYLGAEAFNARMKAENFSSDNLEEHIRYAHFFGVKVYLTINTIIQNNGFNRLYNIVKAAISAGVDAFIVQDLGAARFIKSCFGGAVLHASTQMGVHNKEGAAVAQKLGMKRVILSREVRLSDISDIKQNTGAEIEAFVHGALCTAFSGNCYLSYSDNGASGNCGVCRQLCRYSCRVQSLADKRVREGYFLSAKDLCLAKNAAELYAAGVDSFKIEGRLRRPAYAAEAVTTYRRVLDDAERGKEYKPSDEELFNLQAAYSRGEFSCDAYLYDGKPDIINASSCNHIGVETGRVLGVSRFKDLYKVTVSSSHEISEGDGLKFIADGKEVASIGAGGVQRTGDGKFALFTKTAVPEKASVRLISDSAREKELLAKTRAVAAKVSAVALTGRPLELRGEADGVSVCVVSEDRLEKALNAPTSEQEIAAALEKVADSGFSARCESVATDEVFIAKSRLNALRRELYTRLKDEIIKKNSPDKVEETAGAADELKLMLGEQADVKTNANETKALSLRVKDGVVCEFVSGKPFVSATVRTEPNTTRARDKINSNRKNGGDGIRTDINDGGAVILHIADFADDKNVNAAERLAERKSVLVNLPPLANGRDIEVIRRFLKKVKDKIKGVVSNNLYGLAFADEGYTVVAGALHNAVNFQSTLALKELGAAAVIFSPEAREEKSALPVISVDSRALPLMTLAHCPYKDVYGTDCASCRADGDDLTYFVGKNKYRIIRTRLSECYFGLYPIG